MIRKLSSLALASAFVLVASLAMGQPPHSFPTLGKVIRDSPEIDKLIPKDAVIEVLASGFEWAEGPVWVPAGNKSVPGGGGFVLFSDIPNNRIIKWQEGKGSSVFMEPCGYTGVVDYGREPGTNGLMLDPKGRLVMCEHGDRRISLLTVDGGKRTLADRYQGKRLNSPNDLVFKSNGDLYFTDPPYGLPQRFDDPRKELDFQGIYLLSKSGKLTLLTKEIERPNGIAFSPNEKTLYIAQSHSQQATYTAFPVKQDGTLGEGKVIFDATRLVGKLPGGPDGMCVDKNGVLFATGPGGVLILTPEGKHLGTLATG
ncbi:MAG: SMP-30/gluconolactonase/LRE family protein, partial [Planctomycetales bacterium]